MAILINPFRFAAAGPPHWQELGRTTLSGTSDTIDVTSLAAKPYMMILGHRIQSGACNMLYRFNSDTGTNYALRQSHNGGTDSTGTSQTSSAALMSGDSSDAFAVQFVTNIAAQEKLALSSSITQSATGAGTAPLRREKVYKWANTSNAITEVNCFNDETAGDYASGSEVVVLGYDPADTTGTSVWEELGTTTLSSSSDTLDISFTAKKYLMIKWSTAPTGSDANPNGRCGIGSIDTGSNYAKRENSNGGTDSTSGASGTSDLPTSIAGAGKHYGTIFCVNTSGQEKLMIGESVRDGGTGAGSVPDRKEWVAKYTVTSGQINRWQIFNGSDTGGNDLAIGSTISVWGFD